MDRCKPHDSPRGGVQARAGNVKVGSRVPRQRVAFGALEHPHPEVEAAARQRQAADRAACPGLARGQQHVATEHEDGGGRTLADTEVEATRARPWALDDELDVEGLLGLGGASVRPAHLDLDQPELAGHLRGRLGGRLDRLTIGVDHLAHRPVRLHDALAQPDATVAGGLHRGQVVGDEDQRGALVEHGTHALQAALLEAGVAHGQDLVDEKDVGLQERGHGEAEPHLHAARVELELPVDGVVELRERDDLIEALADLATAQSQQGPVELDVLAAGQVGMDAGPHLDQRADPPYHLHASGVRVHDPGQDLEQSRLAGAVGADEADRLPRRSDQVDIAEGPAPAAPSPTAQPGREVVDLVAQKLPSTVGMEPLPHVRGRDRPARQHRRSPFRGA